ncbi:MAG: TetR/AcrR family transcriptional regulator [Clostridiales bacterium]|jgi:AcrR family transcriptional regulator|nr:TetR/AcrR family transcriptional regulator [Clostridiales bacterium]
MSDLHATSALLKSIPKTDRGRETLERLVEASEELFCQKNYYETSINDIVLKAGISTGTFYIYFDNKLNLYKYIVLHCGHKVRKYIASKLSKKVLNTRYEMEREGIKTFLDYCVTNPEIFFIVWQSFFVVPGLFIAYYDDFCKQYEKRLSDAVRTGEVYLLNLEVASYVLMGASTFIAMKYIVFGPPTGLSDEQKYRIVDDFLQILKNGLFTEKAPEKL